MLITGNLIDNAGPPRYKYAVIIPGGPKTPRGLHFSGNVFPAGTAGVANVELPK